MEDDVTRALRALRLLASDGFVASDSVGALNADGTQRFPDKTWFTIDASTYIDTDDAAALLRVLDD